MVAGSLNACSDPLLHHSISPIPPPRHASAPIPLRPAAHRIPRGGGGPDSPGNFHASAPIPLRPAAHRIPRGGGGPDSITPSFMPPPRYHCGLPLTASQGVEAAPTPSFHLSCLRPDAV